MLLGKEREVSAWLYWIYKSLFTVCSASREREVSAWLSWIDKSLFTVCSAGREREFTLQLFDKFIATRVISFLTISHGCPVIKISSSPSDAVILVVMTLPLVSNANNTSLAW